MTIDSQGRKISNLPADTVVPSGAYFTFVSGSTNYKITKANFLTAMGATGTLVASGSGPAIPVLQTAGSVYTIRGLEDGAGITVSVCFFARSSSAFASGFGSRAYTWSRRRKMTSR